jgi:hypothetical protein
MVMDQIGLLTWALRTPASKGRPPDPTAESGGDENQDKKETDG